MGHRDQKAIPATLAINAPAVSFRSLAALPQDDQCCSGMDGYCRRDHGHPLPLAPDKENLMWSEPTPGAIRSIPSFGPGSTPILPEEPPADYRIKHAPRHRGRRRSGVVLLEAGIHPLASLGSSLYPSLDVYHSSTSDAPPAE
jgi:hypothetical protein